MAAHLEEDQKQKKQKKSCDNTKFLFVKSEKRTTNHINVDIPKMWNSYLSKHVYWFAVAYVFFNFSQSWMKIL